MMCIIKYVQSYPPLPVSILNHGVTIGMGHQVQLQPTVLCSLGLYPWHEA